MLSQHASGLGMAEAACPRQVLAGDRGTCWPLLYLDQVLARQHWGLQAVWIARLAGRLQLVPAVWLCQHGLDQQRWADVAGSTPHPPPRYAPWGQGWGCQVGEGAYRGSEPSKSAMSTTTRITARRATRRAILAPTVAPRSNGGSSSSATSDATRPSNASLWQRAHVMLRSFARGSAGVCGTSRGARLLWPWLLPSVGTCSDVHRRGWLWGC